MQLFVQLKNCQAGDHAALAPVNSDVQASQIPASYIEDTAEVAAAKEIFNEAFEEAKSGGLGAKQVMIYLCILLYGRYFHFAHFHPFQANRMKIPEG